MIRVDFFTAKDGGLNGFQIKGHSGSAASGEDIVCAAVSSAAYLTANTITEILHADASVFVDDGEMALRLPKKAFPNAATCWRDSSFICFLWKNSILKTFM